MIKIFFLFCSLAQAELPPIHPYLADSPWPMSHQNPYQQGSSPFPGPTAEDLLGSTLTELPPVSITLGISGEYPDGSRALWGNTPKKVFKRDLKSGKTVFFERSEAAKDISGAYHLIDRDRVFYVPSGTAIEAYENSVPETADGAIQLKGSWAIPAKDTGLIVGMNLDWRGRLVFVTQNGLVGVLERDFSKFVLFQIKEGTDKVHVSNSLAVDEDHHVFIVSSKNLHRLSLHEDEIVSDWSYAYDTEDFVVPGRLSEGSGTTPDLMNVDGDKLVAIGDGKRQMDLLVLWRDEVPENWKPGRPLEERLLAGQLPVRFSEASMDAAITEQSLLVQGNGIVAVSNVYGEPDFFQKLMARFVALKMGRVLSAAEVVIALSNFSNVAPWGMTKLSWNSEDRKLELDWINSDVSCPNSIPTMSAETGLIYCLGVTGAERKSDTLPWSLEAVSWANGEKIFSHPLTTESKYNSFYAATEVGPNGTILSGMVGGFLEIGATNQ